MKPKTSESEQRKTTDKQLISLAVLALLAVSLFSILSFNPVKALTPTVNNACHASGSTVSSLGVACTVTNIGDVIAIFGEALDSTGNGAIYTITAVTSPGVTGGFTQITSVTAACISSAGFCNGAGQPNKQIFDSLWVGTATSTGTVTVTETASTTADLLGIQDYDMANIGSTVPFFQSTGSCNAVNNGDCGNPFTTSGSTASSGPASVYVVGAILLGGSVGTAGSQFTINSAVEGVGGEYANNNLVPPTNFPLNYFSNSGANAGFATIGAQFSAASITTVTTTVNTGCLGSCSDGANSSSIYLPQPATTFFNLHFYASQNLAQTSQIDNVTIKCAAVHINANSGILYFLVYTVPNGNAPSGGNPYSLQQIMAVTITNNTNSVQTPFFIHVNPQANIAPSLYYAVAIMTTTFASRGSGASLSGISIYESSLIGPTEYKYSVGSATPPTNFFSSTVQTPRDFIFTHSVFSVVIRTTTTTTSLTGLVTSTTTVTSTSTQIINQGDPSKVGFWYVPMFFLLFPTGVFVAIYAMLSRRGVS